MERLSYIEEIKAQFKVHQIVAILGPRQVGKTTLAAMFCQSVEYQDTHQYDLENPIDIAKLEENPMLVLQELEGIIIIDEIQRMPNLFTILRVLVDKNKKQQYLILGSASRDLLNQSAETLAGRIGYIELMPFALAEVGRENLRKLWQWGGFPKAYLSAGQQEANIWLKNYIATFLERDVPALGINVPAANLRRFWMMLAHYHGNIMNYSEIGKSLGLADTTIKRYLDILSGTFMVRQLQPWLENIKKRQVKTPKIYFRDSGILHFLLNITDSNVLFHNPKLGASWEGFALEEIIRLYNADTSECYFWATHSEAELDLLIIKDGKRLGFEIKYTQKPKVTKSMQLAKETLSLDSLSLIYPEDSSFPLTEDIRAIGLSELTRLSG